MRHKTQIRRFLHISEYRFKRHRNLIKGLHNEISSLQQSNRDLQFQVTFSQPPECQIEKLENEIKALHLQTTRNERLHNEKVRSFNIATLTDRSQKMRLKTFYQSSTC